MSQRLTPEREATIRKQQDSPDGCFEVQELLNEIDVLRQELGLADLFLGYYKRVISELKEKLYENRE